MTYNEKIILPSGQEKSIHINEIIQEVKSKEKFIVYPNPADDYFTIENLLADEYLNSKTNISVYLVDINGRLISTFVFPAHQRHKIVKTGNISNGIYFCCFMIDDELIENLKLEIIRR